MAFNDSKAGVRQIWPLFLVSVFLIILIYGIVAFATFGNVYKTSPVNGIWSTNGSIDMFCFVNISDDPNIGSTNLTNVSLWTNITGDWRINQTVNDSILLNGTNRGLFNATSVQFNLTALGSARGPSYAWNCSVSGYATNPDGSTNTNQSYTSGNASSEAYSFFSVDKTAPTILVKRPINGGYINSTTLAHWEVDLLEHNKNTTGVSFYWRRGASGSFQPFTAMSCVESITSNGTYGSRYNCSVNLDISTDVVSGETVQFFFNATDLANNTGSNGTNSAPWSVTVDNVLPVINSFNITVASGTGRMNWDTRALSSTVFNITYNISDLANDSCILYANISSLGLTATNYSQHYISNASMNFTTQSPSGIMLSTSVGMNSSGIYNFSLYCNDSAANTIFLSKNYSIVIDTQAPNVTIYSNNGTSVAKGLSSSRQLMFSFYAADNMNASLPISGLSDGLVAGGNSSCELWSNFSGVWSLNTTSTNNTGFVNSEKANFSANVSSDGDYLWNVQCNDTAGNKGVGVTNFTITVDTSPPVINWINETNVNWNTRANKGILFNFTINATDENADSCDIYSNISGSFAKNVTIPLISNANTTFQGINITDNTGVFNFSFRCNDTSGNHKWFSNFSFVIDTKAPNVTIWPAGTNTWSRSTSVSFNFSAADDFNNTRSRTDLNDTIVSAGNDTCRVWTNRTGAFIENQTDTNVSGFLNNGEQINISFSMPDGIYVWNVRCNDTAGNSNFAGTNRTLRVDSVLPALTLALPANGSKFSPSTLTIFQINSSENNLNDTYKANTTVWFRRLGTTAWRNANLTCWGTAPTYTCNGTADTTVSVLDGETLEYYFNQWDYAANNGTNGTPANPLTAVADTTVPTLNQLNASNVDWNTRTSRFTTFNITFNISERANDTCTLLTNISSEGYTANVSKHYASNISTNFSNDTASSADTLASPNGLSFSSQGSGIYNFSITCNDTAGNSATTMKNITIAVDTQAPNVSIVAPNMSYFISTKTISFMFNASDNMNNTRPANVVNDTQVSAGNSSCEIWTNMTGIWSVNYTDTGYANTNYTGFVNGRGNHNITLTLTSDGVYLWNIQCNDTAGNRGVNPTNYTLTVDTSPPVINWINETLVDWNTRNTRADSFNFTINVTENYVGGNDTCFIYHNASGTLVQNFSAHYISNANISFTSINMSRQGGSGVYNFTFRCNNTAGNETFSRNYTFVMDTQAPNVTLSGPGNASNIRGKTVGFQFSASDNMNNTRKTDLSDTNVSGGNSSCMLWTNMTGSWAVNTTATNYSGFVNGIGSMNFTVTFTDDGMYSWNVECNDTAGNLAVASVNITFIIDNSGPVINWINETLVDWNTRNTRADSFNFTINATENVGANDTCFVYHNASGSLAQNVSGNFKPNANISFTSINMSRQGGSGVYNFTFRCNNTAGNETFSGNYTFVMDTQAPNVTLFGPANNANVLTSVVGLQFNASDNMNNTRKTDLSDTNVSGGNSSCMLWTNMTGSWAVNTTATNYSGFVNGKGSMNFSVTFNTNGAVLWNVECNDTAGNIGVGSANRTFFVDVTGPILSNWTYNESSRVLVLGFGETIDTNVTGLTPSRVSINYTDGSMADGVVNLDGANSSLVNVNSSTVFITLTVGQDAAMKKIQRNDLLRKVNITLHGGAVKDLIGSNSVANVSSYKSYVKAWHESPSWPGSISSRITIPQTSTLRSWGWNETGVGGTQNWNISLVLQNISGLGTTFNVVYYNVGTEASPDWRTFSRTNWAGSSLQYVNNTNDKDYEINMTGTARFELCCRTLT